MFADTSDRRWLVLLIGLCLFLSFFRLGARDLWDVDEGMHSVSAKHVVQSGDWVTPTYNGEAFFDKPMFFTWLVAISFSLLGFTEFAARLPAATLGLLGVVVTFFLGRRMFDALTGFLAGAVLATTLLYLALSRSVVHDSALALCTTAALSLFWSASTATERQGRLFLWFWVAVSGAVLAKGLLGLVLPAIVIVPYLILTRQIGLVRRMRWGWGVLILCLLVAPWYVLMSVRNEGYLHYFLVEKTFGSFASAESTHPEPWHFYLPVFLGAILPWTFSLPGALYRAWRRLAGGERQAVLFLLLWLGSMFLFFSLARSKLVTYLLPLTPAVALLIGMFWAEAMAGGRSALRRLLLWWHLPAAVLVLAGCVYVWLHPPLGLEARYGIATSQVTALLAVIFLGVLLAGWFLLAARPAGAFAAIIVGVMAGLALFAVWIGPSMDDFRSCRRMALAIDRRLPPAAPIVFHWRENDSALFYTDRDAVVLPTAEVGDYLDSDSEVLFLSELRHLHRIEEHRDRFAFVDQIGDKVLISNRPEKEEASAVPEGWNR